MNNAQSAIPITNDCILALSLDFEKGKEHILVGELPEVQRYLRGYKQAVILAEAKREIGTFATECFEPMPSEMADTRIGLAEGLDNKKTPCSERYKPFSKHCINRIIFATIFLRYGSGRNTIRQKRFTASG